MVDVFKYISILSRTPHVKVYVIFVNVNLLCACLVYKMGILEKISEIEKEIARTQKNKGSYISQD